MYPSISIIIPVYQESEIIQNTLDHLKGLTGAEAVETILVDGDPASSTLRSVDLSAVAGVTSPGGRGVQMNRGAQAADGDILLFLHADTLLPPDALRDIRLSLGRKGVVAGAFDLGIDAPGWGFRLIEWAVSVRTRLTRVPYGDQAIFVDARFFRRMGGFREIPIMEDVAFMRRVKRLGGRVAILPSKVRTSARRWKKEGIGYCTLRNWTLMGLYLAGADPHRLVRFYPGGRPGPSGS